MTAAIQRKIFANPAIDGRFSQEAQRHAADGAHSADDLERRLRRRYPRTRVFIGIADGTAERWYAYRGGHWINEGEST